MLKKYDYRVDIPLKRRDDLPQMFFKKINKYFTGLNKPLMQG